MEDPSLSESMPMKSHITQGESLKTAHVESSLTTQSWLWAMIKRPDTLELRTRGDQTGEKKDTSGSTLTIAVPDNVECTPRLFTQPLKII